MMDLTSFRAVDELSSSDFELFVRDVFAAAGWTDLEITKIGKDFAHGDGGVDIVGMKQQKRFALEVKQRDRSSRVDTSALNQLVTGARLRNIANMILVTNSYFTQEVQVRALRLGVELIDRDALQDMWIQRHSEIGRRIVPRKYQQAVIDEIVAEYRAGRSRVLLEMATGLGKTYTAAHLVRRLETDIFGGEIRVLFLAHQVEILLQSVTSFKNVLGIGNRNYSACFNGADPEPTSMVFGSFATLFSKIGRLARNSFDVIIVDEAHHTPAQTFSTVVEHFQPKLLIGLTATPCRHDGQDVLRFFGGANGHLGRYDLKWALKRGYLAFPKYTVLLNDLDQERIAQLGVGLSVSDLDRRLFLHKKDREVVNIIEETVREKQIQNPKGIVFCRNIQHMEHLIQFFPPGSATWVHSKMSGADRQTNITDFREGDYRYILVCDLFNEGIDIPETNLLVFLRYTGSHVTWLQQLGRGLRKTRNKEYVHVLDFVGSLERIYEIQRFSREVANTPTHPEDDEPDPDGESRGSKGIHHDMGMEVTFNRQAAQVLQLIKSLEYRLKSRTGALDTLRNYWSNHQSLPHLDQLETELSDISCDQIATYFDSYYGYVRAAINDPASITDLETECRLFVTKYHAENGIVPSARAVSMASQHAGLPAFTESEVAELAAEVFDELKAVPASEQYLEEWMEDIPPDVPNRWLSDDSANLIRRYVTLIQGAEDLCKLSPEELKEIDRVFESRFLFLSKLRKAREIHVSETS